MSKPCHERHPTPAAGCRLCELAAASAHYQAAWGLPVTADPAADPGRAKDRGRCVHLGEIEGGQRDTPGCRCRYECGHPDDARQAAHPVAVPLTVCQTCPDWEPA